MISFLISQNELGDVAIYTVKEGANLKKYMNRYATRPEQMATNDPYFRKYLQLEDLIVCYKDQNYMDVWVRAEKYYSFLSRHGFSMQCLSPVEILYYKKEEKDYVSSKL